MTPPAERTEEQVRGSLIAGIKNRISFIKILIHEKNNELIKTKINELKQKFDDFVSFTNTCEVVYDNSGIFEYYLEALQSFKNFSEGSDNSSLINSSSNLVSIPKPNVYEGDSQNFFTWYDAMTVYLRRAASLEEKLILLFSLTAGEARCTIEAYEFSPKTKETLDSALLALRHRFGSEAIVSDKYFSFLESFKTMKSVDCGLLRKLSNHIRKGLNMMSRFPSLEVVNSMIFQRQIVSKLPSSLQEAWVQHLISENSAPSTEDLAIFLESKVAVLEHPLCFHGSKAVSCLVRSEDDFPLSEHGTPGFEPQSTAVRSSFQQPVMPGQNVSLHASAPPVPVPSLGPVQGYPGAPNTVHQVNWRPPRS